MELIWNGIKFGIVLAFLVGPVFFALIQTSIDKGFSHGLGVALGVSLSDVLYVVVCFLGLYQFFNSPSFQTYLGYAGGAILILFGVYYAFIKKRQAAVVTEDASGNAHYKSFIKGFIINSLSPMVLVFWLGAVSFASVTYGYQSTREFFWFFFAVLGTVLITDVAKVYLAHRLRKMVTLQWQRVMHVVVGVALIFFGARMIVKMLA
ncbi:MAG: LysE family translocator [Cyclobacteriaceae bacterium]|nr:LysE family translocator [Cyclobacteriaceae bacterium]